MSKSKLIPQPYPLFGYYTTPNEVGDLSAVIGWQKVKVPEGGWKLTPALVPVDSPTYLSPHVFIGDYGHVTYSLFTSVEEAKAEQKEAEAKFHGWEATKDPFDVDRLCTCDGRLHERHLGKSSF